MKRTNIFVFKVYIFVILFLNPIFLKSQNNLKCLSVSDSSLLDSITYSFDKVWYGAMSVCDTCSMEDFTYGGIVSRSSRPLIGINYIGVPLRLIDLFEFQLINKTTYNDSIFLFEIGFGFMNYCVAYNSRINKITDIANLNFYKWKIETYKNLTIYHPETMVISKKELDKSFHIIDHAMRDLSIPKDTFYKYRYNCISAHNSLEADRFTGILYNTVYFNPSRTYGGMSDPYNKVISSGVGTSLHTHEMLHFVVNYLNACRILTEGTATYYGGTGRNTYLNSADSLHAIIVRNNIHSFEELVAFRNQDFNQNRGIYIAGAMIVADVKKTFGNKTLRLLLDNGKTENDMIKYLEKLYNIPSRSIFQKIFNN